MSRWRIESTRVINEAAGTYTGNDLVELEKIIRAAYQFGVRRNHPYKVWLKCVSEYMDLMRRIDGQHKPTSLVGLPLFE